MVGSFKLIPHTKSLIVKNLFYFQFSDQVASNRSQLIFSLKILELQLL